MGTVQGYTGVTTAHTKCQEAIGSSVRSESAPDVDFNQFSGVSRETRSEVYRDYEQYRGVNHDDESGPAYILADFVYDLDEILRRRRFFYVTWSLGHCPRHFQIDWLR